MGIAENVLVVIILSALVPSSSGAQPLFYGTTSAGLSSNWTQTSSWDGTIFSTTLYACGFFNFDPKPEYYFGIHMPNFLDRVVWTANRNVAVKLNSTLELTSDGDLVLKDADGSIAWSSNTSGKSVVGMNLSEAGNLLLFDHNNEKVWQSFDHPTDVLLPGQKLWDGQKLIPSVSELNLSEYSLLSFSLTSGVMIARLETDPPQVYFIRDLNQYTSLEKVLPVRYIEMLNEGYGIAGGTTNSSTPVVVKFGYADGTSAMQLMKFSSDGHLRVYGWQNVQWQEQLDDFYGFLTPCSYPQICGVQRICWKSGQCTCPASTDPEGPTYFNTVTDGDPNQGCTEVTPLSCEKADHHSFLELKNVTYFNSFYSPDVLNLTSEKCREACLSNCSCKAVFFGNFDAQDIYGNSTSHYGNYNSQYGNCTLYNQIFSLINVNDYNSYLAGFNNYTAYIKVQNVASPKIEPNQTVGVASPNRKANRLPVILGSGLGVLALLTGMLVLFVRTKRGAVESEDGEEYLDAVPGMPTRFSYNHLLAMTENFSKKLGEGGFGSVFEGILTDGTKLAVKHLHHLGQAKDSFLTEVTAVSSIRHVNLVTLLGFCAEKSQRLLVYEYVANGSLDRWIFRKDNGVVLGWPMRKKIILDIAKGLNYLHEECSQKIIHLDIKPQNILLDENFSAKVCDFGLSKLIDRDQSQVMTTMRGTPGYLAPEWLNASISEKVDVYSFGVVILEMVCGRRVLGNSSEGQDRYLLTLFKRKADEGRLLDIVDNCCDDVPQHGIEAVDMMKLAAWCLQSDYEKRPSMSVVIKVLEGTLDAEEDLDYSFWKQTAGVGDVQDVTDPSGAPLLFSMLSGPR